MIVELNDADVAGVSAGAGTTKPLVIDFWDDFIDIFWDVGSSGKSNDNFQ